MVKEKGKIFSIRLSEELYNKLEFYSNKRQATKMEFIRLGLEDFLDEARKGMEKEARDNYINALITEDEYVETILKELEFDPKTKKKALENAFEEYEIPEDLKKARQEVINRIKGENK